MIYDNLPERWKKKLAEYLKSQGKNRETLQCGDFDYDYDLVIKYEDGSILRYRYPLLIKAEEFGEVGVFTEHCGYHLFNLYGMIFELVDSEIGGCDERFKECSFTGSYLGVETKMRKLRGNNYAT